MNTPNSPISMAFSSINSLKSYSPRLTFSQQQQNRDSIVFINIIHKCTNTISDKKNYSDNLRVVTKQYYRTRGSLTIHGTITVFKLTNFNDPPHTNDLKNNLILYSKK